MHECRDILVQTVSSAVARLKVQLAVRSTSRGSGHVVAMVDCVHNRGRQPCHSVDDNFSDFAIDELKQRNAHMMRAHL